MENECGRCGSAGFTLCICHGLPPVPRCSRTATKPPTTRFLPGERNRRAKLTADNVTEIYGRLDCEGAINLAREYGVEVKAITRIARGERWAHLTHQRKAV